MMSPAIIYPLVLFCFGGCIGSFLNVVIYRLPRGISIVYPGSMCPGCGRHLRAYENIPIISWLIQRRRCRGCSTLIHWRYPVVELLTALVWAITGYYLHPEAQTVTSLALLLLNLWFISSLIAISFIDLDLAIIPDELNYSGVVVSLLASCLLPAMHPEATSWFPVVSPHFVSLMASGLGLLTGAGVMYAISIIGTLAFQSKIKELQNEDPDIDSAIGFGDIKLMAFLGAFLGWKGVLLAFLLSTIFGSIAGIGQKITTGTNQPGPADEVFLLKIVRCTSERWQSGISLIPYGPFLCMGALAVLFYQKSILLFLAQRLPVLAN